MHFKETKITHEHKPWLNEKKNRGLFLTDMTDFSLLLDIWVRQILKDRERGALFKDAVNC
jgi:hypothetical protein